MLISLVVGGGLIYAAGALAQKLWLHPPDADDAEREVPLVGVGPASVDPTSQPLEAERDRDIRRNLTLSISGTAFLIGGRLVPLMALPGFALLAYSFFGILRRSWAQLRDDGKLGAPLIDTVALTGILASGYWTIASSGTVVVALADWLARQTERQSGADLTDVFGGRVHTVRLRRAGVTVEVSRDEIGLGDVVVVDAGETVPIDGVVVDGVGSVDQQALTGEFLPLDRSVGDAVLASTLLLDGRLFVRATRSADETISEELMQLLREVERTRSEGASRAQATVERWVPPTIAGSLAGLVLFGPATGVAVASSGVGVGLRYAGPTAVLRHLRTALRRGVFVRDGRALERLGQADVVIFDKTGTLTRSTPAVWRVTGFGGMEPRDVVRIAATAERHQSHPIGKALRAAATALDLSAASLDATAVVPGAGLSATVDGMSVLVGSSRLIAAEGIVIPDDVARWVDVETRPEDIIVHLAVDGQLAGVIELFPGIRPEAGHVIAALRARGAEVLILSGDREAPTAALAQTLGVDGFFAELMPREKAEIVQRLQASGKSVCFVGDGINDTIALSTADVSISLRGAATVAENVASILLPDGDLTQLPYLFDLSDGLCRNLDRSTALTVSTGLAGVAGALLLGFGVGHVVLLFQVGVAGAVANSLIVDEQPPESTQHPSGTVAEDSHPIVLDRR